MHLASSNTVNNVYSSAQVGVKLQWNFRTSFCKAASN